MGISTKLIVFLIMGTILMGIPIFLLSPKYKIKYLKSAVLTILLTIVGTIGTFLMFWVENLRIGGISFYGAVFLVPVVFAFIALILDIPYGKIMDMCAVGECIMLALMKVHGMLSGCCIGRELFGFGRNNNSIPEQNHGNDCGINCFYDVISVGNKNQIYRRALCVVSYPLWKRPFFVEYITRSMGRERNVSSVWEYLVACSDNFWFFSNLYKKKPDEEGNKCLMWYKLFYGA